MSEVEASRNKRPKTGGRKKGTPNKTTGELKEMILQALSESGGVTYLKQVAASHPAAYMSLLGKVLPLQVNGSLEHSGGITVNIKQF
jgi:hypothetical protein